MNEETTKTVEEITVESQENNQTIKEEMDVQPFDESNNVEETKDDLQNDGLKFVGIIFIILLIFLILLPYISQMI